jgi:DNA-binding transcriptional LysR family regulator
MTRTRRPITLTRRGQNVLAAAYTLLILIGAAVGLIILLAVAGAIEGGW